MIFSTNYQPAVRCVGGERPGARALQDFLLAEIDKLPGCETVDSGVYNCRKIAGSTRYSTHAEGRAGDVGVRLPDGMWPTKQIREPGIMAWAERLIDHAPQIGLTYIIYARQSRRPGQPWKPYTGLSPHFDHIHWEISRTAAETLTPAYVAEVLGFPSDEGQAVMTITEYIHMKYWLVKDAKRVPDTPGYYYWLDRFSSELADSASHSRTELEATAASEQMVYGLEHA